MLVSKKELSILKLKSILLDGLKELAVSVGISPKGTATNLIERLVDTPSEKINTFIKQKYQEQIGKRQTVMSDADLKKELLKVEGFKWGAVQGQLDQKIQVEYVRKFMKHQDLIDNVESKLHDEITHYVLATWFNHWTTVLIEDHIAQHSKVIPTLKNNFGVDIFFSDQPFDLKITYLPKGYSLDSAIGNPKELIVWLYENQGAQRFGYDNRLFVVLASKVNPDESWKLKRDFPFVFNKIDEFFDKSSVSVDDEVTFNFQGKSYKTVSKILIITK